MMHKLSRAKSVTAWITAWVGGAALGVLNGAIRERVYGGVGERQAHQISTVTLIGALASYFWLLERRWPLPSARDALEVGTLWVALTIELFEFGLGRYGPDPKSWRQLLESHNIARGELWPLVLAAELFGPAAVHTLSSHAELGT
jgi:hypothetical protein